MSRPSGEIASCALASAAGARTSEGGVLGWRDGELDHVLGVRRGGTPRSQRHGRSGDERDRRQRSDQPRETRGSRRHRRRRSKAGLVIQHEQRCRDVADSLAAILDQALPQQGSNRRGDIGREGPPAGSRRTTAPSTSVMSSPSKGRRPVSISYNTQPNAQMSLRLSAARPFICSGAMYGGGPEDDAHAGHHGRARDGRRDRTVMLRSPFESRARVAPTSPTQSRALSRLRGAQLDIRGLQIAMHDSLLVRGFQALAQSVSRSAGPHRAESVHVQYGPPASSPSTSSITSARTPPDFFRVARGICARCSDGFSRRPASGASPGEPGQAGRDRWRRRLGRGL